MDKLNALYEFAAETNISIVNDSFSPTKKAACLHLKPHKLIVLDNDAIESKYEKVTILAEEIGHYETGGLYIIESTYSTPIARNNRIKYEAQALRWAINHSLQPDEISKGMAYGGGDMWLAAEYCQVTVDFLAKAIEHYQSHGYSFVYDPHDDENSIKLDTDIYIDNQNMQEKTTHEEPSGEIINPPGPLSKNNKEMSKHRRRRSVLAKELLDIIDAGIAVGKPPRKRSITDNDFLLLVEGINKERFFAYSIAVEDYKTHEYYCL